MGPVADTSVNSRRTLAFLIVIVVHILLLWGFNAGLSGVIVEKVFGPMETQIIEEVKEEEDRPPPPPPKLETPPPFVPPPDISIEVAPAENTTAIQVTTNVRPTEPPPPPAPVRQAVIERPQYARNPERDNPKPDYPMSEQRAGRECTLQLEIQVLENGRVGDVKVKQPCIHEGQVVERLNASAVETVKRWRMRPGTIDGKPAAMTATIPIVFKKDER